jgi:hypothetical protein
MGITREDYDLNVFKKFLKKPVIEEALIRLVVEHDLPFRLVEWPSFHTLCQTMNPAVKIVTSHSTVSTRIRSSWATAQDLVRRRLQSAISPIHIAADIWTSPNRNLFLGICAQYVDYEEKQLKKVLLALRPVLSHRGVLQATEIYHILQQFGITKKLGYFIGDNHSANDVLCRTLSQLLADEDFNWDPQHHRTRCYGHIINLAVQAFFFASEISIDIIDNSLSDETETETEASNNEDKIRWRSKGPLGKLHNIAVHIRASPTRSFEFRQLAGRGLPLDNDTRWNSWYMVLVVAQKDTVAAAIDTYTKNWQSELEDDYLTLGDWELLRAITLFLEPFYEVTLETQGYRGTIDKVLWTMDILIEHYNASKITATPALLHNIEKSWEVFDKYYLKTEETPVYAAAIILHPSRRTQYLKKMWKRKWYLKAIAHVQSFWEEYRETVDLSTLTSDISELDIQPIKPLSIFRTIAQKHDITKTRHRNKDEFVEYTGNTVTSLDNDTTALDWWLHDDRQRAYPVLSRFAVMVLSAPAMSDEPERVFSGARRTITWTRMQLEVENIEKTQCLKSWLKSGIIDQLSGEVIEADEGSDDDNVEDEAVDGGVTTPGG